MLRTTLLTLVVGLSLGASAVAQDFTAKVEQDPRAGTAVYDFHFDGPPRGKVWLFASPLNLQPSLPLPPFGPLFLDPGAFFPITPQLPLDAQGEGRFVLPLPQPLTNNIPFSFQPVFIDPALNVRLPDNLFILVQGAQPAAPTTPSSHAIAYEQKTGCVEFQAWGKPGTQRMLQIYDDQNRLIDTIQVAIGQNGKSAIQKKQIGMQLPHGFTWQLWERDGNTTTMIDRGRF